MEFLVTTGQWRCRWVSNHQRCEQRQQPHQVVVVEGRPDAEREEMRRDQPVNARAHRPSAPMRGNHGRQHRGDGRQPNRGLGRRGHEEHQRCRIGRRQERVRHVQLEAAPVPQDEWCTTRESHDQRPNGIPAGCPQKQRKEQQTGKKLGADTEPEKDGSRAERGLLQTPRDADAKERRKQIEVTLIEDVPRELRGQQRRQQRDHDDKRRAAVTRCTPMPRFNAAPANANAVATAAHTPAPVGDSRRPEWRHHHARAPSTASNSVRTTP
jgi:hypothetical protein